MFAKSRSNWLNHSKLINEAQHNGRKRFPVHKNDHTLTFYTEDQDFVTPVKKISRIISVTPSPPKPSNSLKLDPLEVSYYKEKLKAKESELAVLKNLFSENTQRILNCEKKLMLASRRIEYAESGVSPKVNRYTPEPISTSMLNYASNPAFKQPLYTKSKPKIMLSNPITGIRPIIQAHNISF